MLDKYYELHGWDKTTSWPTEGVLKDLGLDDQAEELEGKIKKREHQEDSKGLLKSKT